MRALSMGKRPVPPIAIVVTVAFVYCAWLGAHWLRLSYSSGELSLYASRIADLRRELALTGKLPWWTSTFHDGSSEAFAYAGDLPLVPWALAWLPFGPLVAVKLVTLTAIGASGVTMFLCARRLLANEAAAVLAALVFLLHPVLLTNAARTEHICIVVFAAVLPLVWLFFARALESARLLDVVGCAIALLLAVWSQNKYTLEQGLYLAGFAGWSLATSPERRAAKAVTLLKIGALSALLAAFVIVPPLLEMKLVRLFAGDPLDAWRRMFAVGNLGAIVDRRDGATNYVGIVELALIAATAIFGRSRPKRGLFWLIVALDAAALALGHGLESVGAAEWRALGALARDGSLRGRGTALLLLLIALGATIELARRKLTTRPRRLVAAGALTAFLLVPWFRLVSLAPFFDDIRAPASFWELPGAFFGSLLVGFFVTDVLAALAQASLRTAIVAAIAACTLIDAWPFQRGIHASDVAPETIARAQATYAALGEEAKGAPGKVYAIGGPLHLMGPAWGGPPMTTDGVTSYMAPRGTGLLAAAAAKTLTLQRAYFDLVGVRWVVFDESDPQSRTPIVLRQLAAYRKLFAVEREDEDFVVFQVPHPRPYVSGYTHAALSYGDAEILPELALTLAHRGCLLVDAGEARLEEAQPVTLAGFDAIYAPASFPVPGGLSPEVASKVTPLGSTLPPLPPRVSEDDPITALAVTRLADDQIRMRFVATTACTAVVNESDYPYWRATLDGKRVEIRRAAYGLMGVPVEAGPHELSLVYEAPRAYVLSAFLSAVSLVVAIGAAIWERARLGAPDAPTA